MEAFDLMFERDYLLIGSPQTVTELIVSVHRKLEVDHLILAVPTAEGGATERCLRLLAEDVLPAVRQALAISQPTPVAS
jgi:hypothetical protein